MALVAVVLVISLAALGFAAYLVKAVMAADQGTVKMREIAQAVQEGAAAYLRRQFRTLGVFAVIVFLLLLVLPVAEGGWGTRVGPGRLLPVGAFFSAIGRVHRHDAGHPRQRPGRRGGARRRLPAGLPHRLPHRWRRRDDHHRARPVRIGPGAAALRRDRADRPRGLRLRRRPAGHVHACRRRHLHQGRRRRRRPRRQGRGGHPRGRPAQRGDDRRQRGRQRR